MSLSLTLKGARALRPDGWSDAPLGFKNGVLSDNAAGREIDLTGYDILPGIIDLHGDGFERHLAPRRGATTDTRTGVEACAAELAASGITTAYLAQFWSWEGGIRGPDFAERVFAAVTEVAPQVPIDLRLQLRFEVHLIDTIERALAAVDAYNIDYVVLNDHLAHDRLAQGRKPPRLTGQALKAGRSPEAHLAFLQDLHARRDAVPAAMDAFCATLSARGVALGSHDDADAAGRATWRGRGAVISEFPETPEAAHSAREAGDGIILGAPNVVRGASHKGNASARDLIGAGLCDALASDYLYPAPARAAVACADLGLCTEVEAWRMLSDGPARLLGLTDRGRLEAGLRADFVVRESDTKRLVATFAGGALAWMSGTVAERFM